MDLYTPDRRSLRAIHFYHNVQRLPALAVADDDLFALEAAKIEMGLPFALRNAEMGDAGFDVLAPVIVARGAPVKAGGVSAASWSEVALSLRRRALWLLRDVLDDESGVPRQSRLLKEPADLSSLTAGRLKGLQPRLGQRLQRLGIEPIDWREIRAQLEMEWAASRSPLSAEADKTDKKTDNAKRLPPKDVNECARYIRRHWEFVAKGKAPQKTKKALIIEAVGEANWAAMERQLRRYPDCLTLPDRPDK